MRPTSRPTSSAPKQRRGSTITEVLITAALLGLLMLLNLMIYRTGMSGWQKVDAQANLLQTLQVVGSRWSRDVMASTTRGVTLVADAVSLPSPRDEDEPPATGGPNAYLVWRRYVVYYYRPAEHEVWALDVPITPPTDNVQPLQPLASYRSGGKRLASGVETFQLTREGNLLTLRIGGHQKRYGREEEERVSLEFAAATRN